MLDIRTMVVTRRGHEETSGALTTFFPDSGAGDFGEIFTLKNVSGYGSLLNCTFFYITQLLKNLHKKEWNPALPQPWEVIFKGMSQPSIEI